MLFLIISVVLAQESAPYDVNMAAIIGGFIIASLGTTVVVCLAIFLIRLLRKKYFRVGS